MSSNTQTTPHTLSFPALLLAALLASVLLLLSAPAVLAYGAPEPTISVESAGEVAPGSEFSVSVTIEGNTGFAASSFQVNYDTSALQLLGFDTAGVMQGTTVENFEGSTIGNLSLSNITGDGQMFGLRFKVLENAAGGSYDISVALKGGTDKNFIDAQANPVPVSFSAGTVQVPGGAGTGGENPDSNAGANTPGQTNTGNNTAGGNTAAGNTTPGGNTPSLGTSTPARVTATNANGDSLPLQLRGEAGNLEYSMDDGATWEKVPSDGIIVAEDGKRISVFGDGEADYTVQDLPDSMVPLSGVEEGIAPWVWIAIAAAVAVIVIIAIVVVTRRRKAAAGLDFTDINNTSANNSVNESAGYVGKHGKK